MGERAHTKGPWTVDGPPWNQIVWSSAENRVCFLAHSSGLDDDRDIATGRLIAAAPDMFEALVQARDWLRGWASAETQLAIIEAALAKASPSASSGRKLADAHSKSPSRPAMPKEEDTHG